MYLRFYRFFPSFRISTSDDSPPSSPSSPALPSLPAPSPLRTRFSALLSDLSHPRQQPPKTVRWGSNTEIPLSPIKLSPFPELKPEPEPVPKLGQGSLAESPQTQKQTPKPIIKPPTPLDHEMLRKNMWEMVTQAEEKVRLNHEYLDVVGDDILDSWFKVEERAMHKSANRAARSRREGMVAMGIPRPRVAKRKKKVRARAKRGVKRCVTKCVSLEEEEGKDAGPKSSQVTLGGEKLVRG